MFDMLKLNALALGKVAFLESFASWNERHWSTLKLVVHALCFREGLDGIPFYRDACCFLGVDPADCRICAGNGERAYAAGVSDKQVSHLNLSLLANTRHEPINQSRSLQLVKESQNAIFPKAKALSLSISNISHEGLGTTFIEDPEPS